MFTIHYWQVLVPQRITSYYELRCRLPTTELSTHIVDNGIYSTYCCNSTYDDVSYSHCRQEHLQRRPLGFRKQWSREWHLSREGSRSPRKAVCRTSPTLGSFWEASVRSFRPSQGLSLPSPLSNPGRSETVQHNLLKLNLEFTLQLNENLTIKDTPTRV